MSSEWFFTAPVDTIAIRRGDPLGMRADAERFAELLAPGLSNRTADGRWLTIMCWALEQAHAAWYSLGRAEADPDLAASNAGKEIYSWLRPLELLWVARTVEATDNDGRGRQLPGVLSVRRWVDDKCRGPSFGLAPDSYARYRFTGTYGAYRVALRSLPGLTSDGWRLGPLGKEMAGVMHKRLKWPRTHRRNGRRSEPERYWQKFDWPRVRVPMLPTVLATPESLPPDERELLRRALFSSSEGSDSHRSDGARRRAVVEAAAASRATTRAELCADIAQSLGGGRLLPELALLSTFCELSDAGITAMNTCWAALGEHTTIADAADVLSRRDVVDALDELAQAARRWQLESTNGGRRIDVADALSEAMVRARRDTTRQFQALEHHHKQFGAGRRWLELDRDRIISHVPARGGDTSLYGFRLGALSRLGVQAGVINEIPRVLRDTGELDEEADSEGEE